MIPSSFFLIHRATASPTPSTSPSEPLPPQAATSPSLLICSNSSEQVCASSLEEHRYPGGLQRDHPGPQLTPFLGPETAAPAQAPRTRGARALCWSRGASEDPPCQTSHHNTRWENTNQSQHLQHPELKRSTETAKWLAASIKNPNKHYLSSPFFKKIFQKAYGEETKEQDREPARCQFAGDHLLFRR